MISSAGVELDRLFLRRRHLTKPPFGADTKLGGVDIKLLILRLPVYNFGETPSLLTAVTQNLVELAKIV